LKLKVNARKLRQLARNDIEQAARDGTTGLRLYTIILGLRRMAKSDIQCLEGVNSMVKCIGNRAPNMSLALLASRIVSKKPLL
jgi:hypothetical protein